MTAAPQNTDLQAQEWLHHLDDTKLACRLGHRWPRWKPGPLGKGWKVEGPYRNGVVELVQVCLEGCGKERRMVTSPDALLATSHWNHNNPEGYASPRGARIRPRDCFNEALRRSGEDIRAQAKPKPAKVKVSKS